MTAVVLHATIPAIKSGILISGNGDGAQIKLEIPESDMLEVAKLLAMRGEVLKVTITLDDGTGYTT